MDLLAALFAIGTIYSAYFEYSIVKRLRTNSGGNLTFHMRVKYTIQFFAHIVAAILFALSAVLSETSLFIDGVYAMLLAGVTSLVFQIVRPRQ